MRIEHPRASCACVPTTRRRSPSTEGTPTWSAGGVVDPGPESRHLDTILDALSAAGDELALAGIVLTAPHHCRRRQGQDQLHWPQRRVVLPRAANLGTARVCLFRGSTPLACANVDQSPRSGLGQRKAVFVRNGLSPTQTHRIDTRSVGRVELDGIVALK